MNESEANAAMEESLKEGRVNGKYRCPRCGMRNRLKSEALDCCRGLGPPELQLLSEARFEHGK